MGSGLGSGEFLQVLILGVFRGEISVCGSFALLLSACTLWSDSPPSKACLFTAKQICLIWASGLRPPPPPVDALWPLSWWCFSVILQHKQVYSAELISANVSLQDGGGGGGLVRVDGIWVLSRSLRFHVSAPTHPPTALNTETPLLIHRPTLSLSLWGGGGGLVIQTTHPLQADWVY